MAENNVLPPDGNNGAEIPNSGMRSSKNETGVSLAQRLMTYCGAILVLTGAVAIVYGLWTVVQNDLYSIENAAYPPPELMHPFWVFVLSNQNAAVLLVSGVVTILLGTGLMRRAVAATAQTISERDRGLLEPLIANQKEEAITQYVRLASLSGLTGFFTKLGFTGLPLVTAVLGVLLIVLAIAVGDPAKSEQLMDLAKLVIGAFLGSFVQRNVASEGRNIPEKDL